MKSHRKQAVKKLNQINSLLYDLKKLNVTPLISFSLSREDQTQFIPPPPFSFKKQSFTRMPRQHSQSRIDKIRSLAFVKEQVKMIMMEHDPQYSKFQDLKSEDSQSQFSSQVFTTVRKPLKCQENIYFENQSHSRLLEGSRVTQKQINAREKYRLARQQSQQKLKLIKQERELALHRVRQMSQKASREIMASKHKSFQR